MMVTTSFEKNKRMSDKKKRKLLTCVCYKVNLEAFQKTKKLELQTMIYEKAVRKAIVTYLVSMVKVLVKVLRLTPLLGKDVARFCAGSRDVVGRWVRSVSNVPSLSLS